MPWLVFAGDKVNVLPSLKLLANAESIFCQSTLNILYSKNFFSLKIILQEELKRYITFVHPLFETHL